MLDEGIPPNEVTVPMLPCVAPEVTLAFWRALADPARVQERRPAAFRALNSGLRRHGDSVPAVQRAVALAVLIELSTALEEPQRVSDWGARLRQLSLTVGERRQVESAVADPTLLKQWMPAIA